MLEEEYLSGHDFLDQHRSFLKEIFAKQTFLVLFGFLILTNLIYLDLTIGSLKSELSNKNPASLPTITPQAVTPTSLNSCPQSCLDQINLATSSSKIAAATNNNNATFINTNSPVVKEFFVPLGNGTTTASDWTDVPGLQATVDTNNYGRIKSAVLEATLHIPTANETASVRLFNVTDKHPVWFSDLSGSGSTAQLFISSPLTLDSGNKTYQVQAKTSLQYEAILDQVRLHIITY